MINFTKGNKPGEAPPIPIKKSREVIWENIQVIRDRIGVIGILKFIIKIQKIIANVGMIIMDPTIIINNSQNLNFIISNPSMSMKKFSIKVPILNQREYSHLDPLNSILLK